MNKELLAIREECENSLKAYAQWVSPDRYYGDLHFDLFDYLQYGEGRCKLALVPRDHQKAQVLTDKILTPTGWTTFGEVNKGDYVTSVDGYPQRVIGLKPIHTQDVWEVELDDGRVITCNEEHLFTTECPSNWGKEVFKTKPLKWIKERYKSKRFDKRNGKDYDEFRFFVHPSLPVQCEKKELGLDPYTLGFWLGDGTTCRGDITTADAEVLEYIPYKHTKHKAKYCYGIEGLTTKLRKVGVLNNKHIPQTYMFASVEDRVRLLQGLIDSDGHVHKVNRNLSYSTILPQLRDDVCSLVRSLGGKAKWCNAYTSYESDGEVFHSYTINIWLPDNIKPCRLKRKAERVQRGQRLKSAIVDIRYKGKEEARCIVVECENGLYLSNDYFVTHNSWCAAVYASWILTIKPWSRINYVSWSESLVNAQMTSIEQLLYSEAHRELWPEHLNFERDVRKNTMVHKPTEGWNKQNFYLDHPSRKERMVRDPSVRATTAKSGNTGMHSDYTIFDDLVTDENWDTVSGKEDVLKCYKSFAKINSSGGEFVAVGTKYSEDDLYTKMLDIEYTVKGEKFKRWSVFERVAEDSYRRTGDGTFCWPKQQMPNGEWYGFDEEELAIKKADALIDGDLGLFYGQYYNDPADESTNVIKQSDFKYMDLRKLEQHGKDWYYDDTKLKLYAAADLAWTDSSSLNAKRRDYTALSVVGIDDEGYIYVLALERFQTDKPEVYYEKIIELQEYWQFKKITVETNAAGKIIKNFLEDEIRRQGGRLEVEGKAHVSHSGKKEERVATALHSRYRNGSIYHTKGGLTKLLEEELKLAKPPHDDLKDVLAIAVSECVAPLKRKHGTKKQGNVIQLSRFGGGRRGRR